MFEGIMTMQPLVILVIALLFFGGQTGVNGGRAWGDESGTSRRPLKKVRELAARRGLGGKAHEQN